MSPLEQTPQQKLNAYQGAGVVPPTSPVATPIAADALTKKQTPLSIPFTGATAPLAFDPTSILQNAQNYVSSFTNPQESQIAQVENQLAQLGIDTPGRAQTRTQAQTAAGIPALQTTVNDLSAQALNLKAQYENIPQKVNDVYSQSDALQGFMDTRTRAIQDRLASQQRLVVAQLEAAQGNLASAQAYVNQAVDDEFRDRELKQQNLKDQRSYILDAASRREVALSKAQEMALKEQERKQQIADQEIAAQKEERKGVLNIVNQLAQYGVDPALRNKVAGAKSIEEAYQLAGPSITDPKLKYEMEGLRLANQLRSAQLDTEKLQQDKIRSETPTAGAPLPSIGDKNLPLATGSKKEQTINAITKLKLNEGQGSAVSYALRMAEANAALNRQVKGGYDPTAFLSGASFGRTFNSNNSRMFNREMENFVRAQLRKESGAVITDEELAQGKRQYSPAGILTNKLDIDQTAATRKQAIDSMIAQAGPAATYVKQYVDDLENGGLLPDEHAILYGSQSAPASTLQADQVWQ